MKKNIGNLNLKSGMLLSLVILLFASCKKSDTINNPGPGNGGNSNVIYKFSNPQRIDYVGNFTTAYVQQSYISTNHIYHRGNSSGEYMDFENGFSGFNFTFPDVPVLQTARQIRAATGPFCVDKIEQNVYVLNAGNLYKCNFATLNVTDITQTTDVGAVGFIKVLDNGDLIFSTDLSNGSIQRIPSGSSTPSIIISNLGATPNAIDVLNNEFYFTLDLATNGNVKKVTSSGSLSAVIDNLTHPSRLVFDNNENLIVESQVTLDGGNYGQYTIYTKTGSKITDITDDNNNLILGIGTELMVPLYVDSNNNLFFGHSDYNGTSTINHSNPFINGNYPPNLNIYKLQLIKQ